VLQSPEWTMVSAVWTSSYLCLPISYKISKSGIRCLTIFVNVYINKNWCLLVTTYSTYVTYYFLYQEKFMQPFFTKALIFGVQWTDHLTADFSASRPLKQKEKFIIHHFRNTLTHTIQYQSASFEPFQIHNIYGCHGYFRLLWNIQNICVNIRD